MEKINFEKIIKKDFSKYVNLSKNICRQIYKIELNKKNYILKLNNSKTKEEYELIIKTILTLNETKFKTSTLIFSKYENNTSYFLFEYLNGIETKIFEIKDIINIVQEFYKITENISNKTNENHIIKTIENNLENFSFIHKNILHKIIIELKEIRNQNRIIITDINQTNFIQFKKNIYLIDFDEICFSEIEYDIAQIFLNFILYTNSKNSLEQNIIELKKIIIEFKNISEIYNLKIINYLIISMYHDIIKYNHKKEIQENIFKKIIYILNNKELILKRL